MTVYKFKDAAIHADLVTYLSTRPLNEVESFLPVIKGEASQDFDQDDIVKTVTYLINRPYFEVFKIANRLVNIDESKVEAAPAPEASAVGEQKEAPQA